VAEPSETDWAYAAGIVDGEGCIAVVRSFVPARGRYYYGVNVVVANTNRDMLSWMQCMWGGWVVEVPNRKATERRAWAWRCTSLGARIFLRGIRPWLRIKAEQCDNALRMIELLQRGKRTLGRAALPQAWLDDQEKLYWIQRELNHRGTKAFVAQAMHSPRKIHRERAQWSVEPSLSTASSRETEPVELPPLTSYEARIEQLARDLAFGDNLVVYEYHGDTEVIETV
jgi:hypothetical protein